MAERHDPFLALVRIPVGGQLATVTPYQRAIARSLGEDFCNHPDATIRALRETSAVYGIAGHAAGIVTGAALAGLATALWKALKR